MTTPGGPRSSDSLRHCSRRPVTIVEIRYCCTGKSDRNYRYHDYPVHFASSIVDMICLPPLLIVKGQLKNRIRQIAERPNLASSITPIWPSDAGPTVVGHPHPGRRPHPSGEGDRGNSSEANQRFVTLENPPTGRDLHLLVRILTYDRAIEALPRCGRQLSTEPPIANEEPRMYAQPTTRRIGRSAR